MGSINKLATTSSEVVRPISKNPVKLTSKVVQSFRVAKVFRENTDRINQIDFSAAGDRVVTSAFDDQIDIYDCNQAVLKRTLNSKKYGVDLINFTHAPNAVIHSSVKVDDTIRYLSLHDNKYIRYFTGHTKRVTSLCMSPISDAFLSASEDKQLRIWDLQSPNCEGIMHLKSRAVAAFDPEGLIFAAGFEDKVKLYDLRSYDKGPFSTFEFYDPQKEWTSLKFSPNGKTIMTSEKASIIRIIDSFKGAPVQTFLADTTTTAANNQTVRIEASYSPDSKFVFCGSTNGLIHVWSIETGLKLCSLRSDHPGTVQCVKFNPKLMMLATACTNLAFWLPSDVDDDDYNTTSNQNINR